MKLKLFAFLLGILCSLSVAAQTPATPLVTLPVDESKLVALRGTVHQLAQARYDRGAVNPSTLAERLLLVLNRPPEREAAFQQLLIDLHTPSSPSYHHWLTPDQIGAQFGPAGSDMDAVTGWLRGSGFNVSRVSRALRFIEFSGTVGQVNSAFHTEIHEYMVNGALHHANSTAVQIPQALAGIVKGLSPLHDFRPAPLLEQGGRGHYDAASRQFVPEFNLPSSWTPLLYGVVPADFYTQYDLAPLYAANVTGAGKTIGIIDESNIDVGLANDYRSLFGVTANPVQVVLDGGDPGMSSSDTETYLDVELAGAVAPGATVNLYLSAGSAYQDPLALAALRAIDDNQADVLSVSWGSSEQELEASGNQLWDGLWEQAAAQGQTVLVATGDYGQVPGEEYFFTGGEVGPAVNGLASTPWNVAVGGTDFYYSDYASGAPSASTFWNATNDPVTKGSLKAPLTEQVWNDPFGLDPISDGLQRGEIYAGGGGASSCAILAAGATCQSGYAKPSWQTGPGVPADGVRDIPDVALFASNGANYSGYITCDYEGACVPDSSGNFGFDLVGGTSASTPAMAGIMALVDQKYGRQGQADATLYPLAQQKPSAFHDITLGGNWDICVEGDADCTLGVAGMGADGGESTVYSATPGFDLASGWGSVDAANLVNNWDAITFQSTSTTLQVSPAQITHGANVTLTADVSAASGSGTPTGAVAILSTSTSPSSAGQTAMALNAGSGSATLNNLPGGTYQLSARYGGDGVFSSSTSSPQALTVKPELSKITLEAFGEYSSTPGTTFNYGELAYLAAQPQGTSSLNDGPATGSVTFTIDNAPTVVPLNVGGVASFVTPILSVGPHTVDASYAGDNSFEASTAAPLNLTVTKGYPAVNINLVAPQEQGGPGWQVNPGGSITVTAFVGPEVGIFTGGVAPVGTVGPTGTVTVCLNTNFSVGSNPCSVLGAGSYSATAALVPATGVYGLYSEAAVTFTNLGAGGYMPQFEYNGDNNWQTYGEFYLDYVDVMAPAAQPTPAIALSIAPGSISGTQEALLTTTVTGTNGVAPTGVVEYFNSGNLVTYDILVPSATGATSTDAFEVSPAWFWNNGANQIVAVYEGDSNYGGATSNAVSLTVSQTIGDFMIAPVAPQVTVASGSTQSLALNLTSVNNFNSTLALTCAPSSTQFSCGVTPASSQLNGMGSATLTVTATIPGATAKAEPIRNPARRGWLGAGAAVAFCIVLVLPLRRRRWNGIACLIVLLAASLLSACTGGAGNGSTTPPPPPPANGTPAGTYTVLITGTANGITHTSKVTVVVQ